MLDTNNKLIKRARPKWPDKFDRTNVPWTLRDNGVIRPKVKLCQDCNIRRVLHHYIYCDVCWSKRNDK